MLAFPLAGSLVIALGFQVLSAKAAGWIAPPRSRSPSRSIGALLMLLDEPTDARQLTGSLYQYASAAASRSTSASSSTRCRSCLVVVRVSTLIHLYSVAYMTRTPAAGASSYLNFFVFSMLLLVLAGNNPILIVGWAFVGFASYALISYWYRRPPRPAGMKAFVINVVGDIGLVFAAFFVFRELGTFDFLDSFDAARENSPPTRAWWSQSAA